MGARMTDCPLTFKQREILQALGNGHGRKEVARELRINIHNVDATAHLMRQRLGVATNLQAVILAARHGWILLDGLEATETIPLTDEHRMIVRRMRRPRLADIGTERDWMRDLIQDLAEPVDYPLPNPRPEVD
jgi:DNA-binding CsgD family transcriptional regulator